MSKIKIPKDIKRLQIKVTKQQHTQNDSFACPIKLNCNAINWHFFT